MINGQDLGASSDSCYLGVFRSERGYENTWQVGNVMMAKYYVIYDMTSYDEHDNAVPYI